MTTKTITETQLKAAMRIVKIDRQTVLDRLGLTEADVVKEVSE